MNDVKIIFFDIDGTLIDVKKKRITETMLNTLKQLKKNGVRICLATGRSPMALPRFEGVEFDAYLTYNGSYCFDGETEIFSNPIPTKDVLQLIENAKGMGRPLSLATKDRLASNGKDDDLVDYYAFIKLEVEVAQDFDAVSMGGVYQIMLGSRKEDYDVLMKDVDGAKIAAWWDRAVDVIPASGGKGVGIEKVIEYFGLERSQSLAFGDGNNDIEMLMAAGTGVAMENASEELKAVADCVCGHVAQEGIYHYCKEHGLI